MTLLGAFLCKYMGKKYSPQSKKSRRQSWASFSSLQLWLLSLHNSPPPSLSLSCTRFSLLFWRAICIQRGRSEWVRAGGSVSVSSLDMFRLKAFAPRNNLLWTQAAAGRLVSSSGNLKCFEYVEGGFPFSWIIWILTFLSFLQIFFMKCELIWLL